MARRKRQFLDDDDSDSSQSSDTGDIPEFEDTTQDARDERALFEDPYKRKKRKKDDKEDALYGVFAEDSGDERARDKRPRKRSDWTRAPAFVSGDKMEVDKESLMGEQPPNAGPSGEESGQDGQDDGSDDSSDESESSRPPSPRVREEEDDPATRPRFGIAAGIGISHPSPSSSGFTKAGIGGLRSTLASTMNEDTSHTGYARATQSGGIGSASRAQVAPPSTSPTPSFTPDVPGSFSSTRAQRSFLRETGTSSPRPATPLSATERLHFNKLQGTFGARMLAKMGWEAGTGLGTTGEGIVTPVETKLRPQKMGIAFKGFREKTDQSKAEARRRGEVVSDDEGESRKRAGKKVRQDQEKRSDAWRRPKKVKIKVEHKSYEQIVAEAGQDAPVSGIEKIIDATGATPREVSSLADISMTSWTPSTDPTRIPELRHNLRLILDGCKSDLDGLAREAKALEQRKRWLVDEDARLLKKVDEEAEAISRLQRLHLITDDMASQSRELASAYDATLDPFTVHVHALVDQYPKEFEKYCLDEFIVAAIAPLLRRLVAQWRPLEEPSKFISTFRTWRKAVRVTSHEESRVQVDVYGTRTTAMPTMQQDSPMTPFDSLLWNIWLPKVRSCINNEWAPQDPDPAVKLFETWSTFLPAFIRDNILDQLILPKVQKAVAEWRPGRDQVPLQTLVFPWLPHVGLRLEDVVGDARRKVKSLLRTWAVSEPIPTDLQTWRDLFDTNDWDTMILKYVVPKLGATLRNDFRINPRNQDMAPLQAILCWPTLIRPSIFSHLLLTEFFPKWLDVLHLWLVQPKVNFEEVAQWYQFWKGTFPEVVHGMDGVANGFLRGLQLMNKAIELGPDAPTSLPRPDHSPPGPPTPQTTTNKATRTRTRHQETFRSIAEDFAASHNLLFVPTGRAHEKSRMPLLRVSQTVDGKGGLLVYVLDDAVWAAPAADEEYRAISLEDMVSRANA